MGWNDHVEFMETECRDCGEINTWEYWSEIGKKRYTGAAGKLLNVDVGKSDKCPTCGSTNGRILDEEDYEVCL